MGVGFIFDLAVISLVAGVVGWACRWVQLSTVVGYLVAGILIGPHTPPFQLVEDTARVQMLADLGLLFLVFGIGLGFSLRRLRRLGAPLVFATATSAVVVLMGCRYAAWVLGLPDQYGLFVAGVLMVSSSAIIAKVLEETGSNHTRWGQLALGVTLLEDIVAIVMLTLLGSIAHMSGDAADGDGGGGLHLGQLLTAFTGFVAVLFVAAMLLVPRLLRRMKQSATTELMMLLTCGLLLLLGWLAVTLGYSMALTAFILGAIIGSTPHQPEIDRLFEGMRHLFGAVFFVAMGMMFDVGRLGDFWPLMLVLTVAAFALRIPATVSALVITGNSLRDGMRAGFTLTPLGEFSFVIAFLGVQTGLMPETFYPAAVGASLLTCVLSPVLIRRAESMSDAGERVLPARLKDAIQSYHEWLDRLVDMRQQSVAWNLMAPRIAHVVVHLLLASGCMALAAFGYEALVQRVGPDLGVRSGTAMAVTLLTGMLVLPPLVAAWRNIAALSMIAAEATAGVGQTSRMYAILHRTFAATAALFAVMWLAVLIPTDTVSPRLLAALLLLLALVAVLLWRQLIKWHSRLESTLQKELRTATQGESQVAVRRWQMQNLGQEAEWRLHVREVNLPLNSAHAGCRLMDLQLRREYGCSIVGIDRQGFAINNPSGTDRLFPDDRVLVLGSQEALGPAVAFLANGSESPQWMHQFNELGTEFVVVPESSPKVGRTLLELDPINRHGVQIGGIRRGGVEIASPGGTEVIRAGDELLLLGDHNRIRSFVAAMLPGE